MSVQAVVNDRLAELGSFKLDGNGLCQISHGHDVDFTVEAQDSADVALLHGMILRAKVVDRAALFARALAMNLMLVDEPGLRIGYEANLDDLVLVLTLTARDIAERPFAQILEAYAARVRDFRETLAPATATAEPAHEGDDVVFRA